ncbi:hypothetical protein H5410_030456 [Solanum commersonii]|uniref:Uncharacterized protein n=1 Tax=Solanum commersonii TaxID=4109 RepID=A0A9J5YJE0_SOLCO|nr:hypothetical protein H5410_030456 [Solanum commersonii]
MKHQNTIHTQHPAGSTTTSSLLAPYRDYFTSPRKP